MDKIPKALDHRFEALLFDWDGTAVASRKADASEVRKTVEDLCELGMVVAIVTGTNIDNVDPQLLTRPHGPGRLYLGLNRGSEIFRVKEDGARLVHRRKSTQKEEKALDKAAALIVEWLSGRGLECEIVSDRLNRRKIDLIPLKKWQDPPKAQIGELYQATMARLKKAGFSSLSAVVTLATAACQAQGLEAKITSDAKYVEIGLTDKSDSAHWIFSDLTHHGISPSQVLVLGDEWGTLGGLPGSDSLLLPVDFPGACAVSVGKEPTGTPKGVFHLPGGPERFLKIIQDQLKRRQIGELPYINGDRAWVLRLEDEGFAAPHVTGTLADGLIGTNAYPVVGLDEQSVRALGIYIGDGPQTKLIPCPHWSQLAPQLVPNYIRRALDMRAGMLRQSIETEAGPVEAVLFSSLVQPGVTLLRAKLPVPPSDPLAPPAGANVESGENWMLVAGHGGVVAAGEQVVVPQGDAFHVDRMAAYVSDSKQSPNPAQAKLKLTQAQSQGYESLLSAHRSEWAARWRDCNIEIDGDPALDRAVRFCLFHLIAAAQTSGESAVGAGALTGERYHGHVFWDTDVFVLPFLAATNPLAARSILEYRLQRLGPACERAQRLGFDGARFAWESATSGQDVTPQSGRDGLGKIIRIRTGEIEEHITGDVAWAAAHYDDWTGEGFTSRQGRDLIVESARYWASRVRKERENNVRHIYGVIGPDEYHEPVDDNAYTNVLARWNLRYAAKINPSVRLEESEHWLEIADHLIDGYVPETRIYEQCAGFFKFEPIIIAKIAPRRPVDAEALLGGHARLQTTQVVKQADVLMLHHLLPDEVAPNSLQANLDYYEPRTAHHSSLSPAIHAALLARTGKFYQALEYLHMAAFLDLRAIPQEHSEGLHLATLGGVWQAIVFGFAGIRPRAEALEIDPRLPNEWQGLTVRVRYHGGRVVVRIRHGEITVQCERPTPIKIQDKITIVGPEDRSFDF